MSQNTIKNQTIQNILLNKDLYSKYILRSKKSKDLGLIDCNVDFSNALIKNKVNLGESIYYEIKNFKHRNYKELTLKTFLPFTQLSPEYQQANELNKSINSILNNSRNYMNILSPIKGGFYGYYSGIYGFIPKSQLKSIIAKSLKNNILRKDKLANQVYFSNLHNTNNWLKPRVKFKLSKMSIIPYSITNNFVIRKKRRTFKSKLNFVFIAE